MQLEAYEVLESEAEKKELEALRINDNGSARPMCLHAVRLFMHITGKQLGDLRHVSYTRYISSMIGSLSFM